MYNRKKLEGLMDWNEILELQKVLVLKKKEKKQVKEMISMKKVKVKEYINYLNEQKYKFRKYKQIEELTVTDIDRSRSYPVAICKNQVGKTVKIGVAFLKIYYTKVDENRFVLENNKIYQAVQIPEEICFVSTEGRMFYLNTQDYIVIGPKEKIFGVNKQDFEDNFVLASRYKRTQDKLKQSKTKLEENDLQN